MSDLMRGRTLCTARRRNGEPCQNPPMKGSAVCRMHGGAAPQVRRRAQQRLLEASDLAAARLIAMMQDKSMPPAVQLAAAKDLLDRAGVASPDELVVSLGSTRPSWEDVMAGVLIDVEPGDPRIAYADRSEEILEAEVVEDPPARASNAQMHVQPTPSARTAHTKRARSATGDQPDIDAAREALLRKKLGEDRFQPEYKPKGRRR